MTPVLIETAAHAFRRSDYRYDSINTETDMKPDIPPESSENRKDGERSCVARRKPRYTLKQEENKAEGEPSKLSDTL